MAPSAACISVAIFSQFAPLPINTGVPLAAVEANSKSSKLGGLPVAQPDKMTASAKPCSMVSCTALVKFSTPKGRACFTKTSARIFTSLPNSRR